MCLLFLIIILQIDMFTTTRIEVEVDAATYVSQYHDAERVQGYCSQCNSYGRVWGCPPFDFDLDEYLSGYTHVRLFGTKVTFDEEVQQRVFSVDERKLFIEKVLDEVWADWLPKLYEMEAANPGSRVFTGRCRLCRPMKCSRIEGKPCRHPDKLRHSLEAAGFDVTKSVRELLDIELQWGDGKHLPPYITLVTALFTK